MKFFSGKKLENFQEEGGNNLSWILSFVEDWKTVMDDDEESLRREIFERKNEAALLDYIKLTHCLMTSIVSFV